MKDFKLKDFPSLFLPISQLLDICDTICDICNPLQCLTALYQSVYILENRKSQGKKISGFKNNVFIDYFDHAVIHHCKTKAEISLS